MTGAVWRLAAAAGARAGAEPQRRSLRRGFHVYAAGCRRMGRHDGLPRNRQAACQAPRVTSHTRGLRRHTSPAEPRRHKPRAARPAAPQAPGPGEHCQAVGSECECSLRGGEHCRAYSGAAVWSRSGPTPRSATRAPAPASRAAGPP